MTIRTVSRIFFILIFLNLFGVFGVFAQNNILKVDPINSIMGNYSISYERVVNKKQSININLSVMPDKDLFKLGADAFDVYSEIDIENRISGFSVSPEYRFYFGKDTRKSPRGFYIAPYLRVSDYKLLLHDTFEDHKTQVDVDFLTAGLGVQLGAHWIFSDKYSLDLQFFGIGIDRHNLTLDYSTKEEGVDFSRYGPSVEGNNSDVPFIGSKIKTEWGDDYIHSNAKVIMPGVRGRLTFGIAF